MKEKHYLMFHRTEGSNWDETWEKMTENKHRRQQISLQLTAFPVC